MMSNSNKNGGVEGGGIRFPIDAELARHDALRAFNPEIERPFSSFEDACHRSFHPSFLLYITLASFSRVFIPPYWVFCFLLSLLLCWVFFSLNMEFFLYIGYFLHPKRGIFSLHSGLHFLNYIVFSPSIMGFTFPPC